MPVSAMKNCPSNRTPGVANLGGKVSFGPAFSIDGANRVAVEEPGDGAVGLRGETEG